MYNYAYFAYTKGTLKVQRNGESEIVFNWGIHTNEGIIICIQTSIPQQHSRKINYNSTTKIFAAHGCCASVQTNTYWYSISIVNIITCFFARTL